MKGFVKNSDMRELVKFAGELGYSVELTRGKHLKFIFPGLAPIFTASTPSDYRSWANCRARLKRMINTVVA